MGHCYLLTVLPTNPHSNHYLYKNIPVIVSCRKVALKNTCIKKYISKYPQYFPVAWFLANRQ